MSDIYQSGFSLVEDFIDSTLDFSLLLQIQHALSDSSLVKRDGGEGRSRFRRFGFDYDHPEKMTHEIPPLFASIGKRISELLKCPAFDSVTINEYRSGAGIAPHIDSLKFGNEIAILSLNESGMMEFTSPAGEVLYAELLPRSLAVLKDDIRYRWKHSIKPEAREKTRYTIVYRWRK